MADPSDLFAQAERCRRLAKGIDERTASVLLQQAEEYEAAAHRLFTGRRLAPNDK
jgi:hypothetical protein